MSKKRLFRALLVALLLIVTVVSWQASAQEATPEATPVVTAPVGEQPQQAVPVTFTNFEPTEMTTGQENITITVIGSGFTNTVPPVIRLDGFGVLATTQISDTLLTAKVPPTISPNTDGYTVRVIVPGRTDPPDVGVNGIACSCSQTKFKVKPIPPTQAPPPDPTAIPPSPAPPSPVPGAPSLLIRSFSANPTTINPGGTVTFTVEVVNAGTRTAEGLAVSVDSGGKFIPANGQSTILLPNLGANSSTVISIPVVAAEDITAGPQSVPITMTYRDFSGENYTSKGTLTVTIQTVATAPQVTLARYLFDPNPVIPGKPVTITVLLTNTGNSTAEQVLVGLGENGILLAGAQGNSFPVGDLAAGASQSVEMPLIVNTTAKPGPQAQTLSISFLQKGEAKTSTASMTLDVAAVQPTAPVLLLDTFDIGKSVLQPGDEFTAEVKIKNVGKETADNMLLTFGTVTPDTSGGTPVPGSGSTNPSSTFAPIGSGDTIFIGTLEKDGGIASLTQQFIVSGSVDTGIYSLPITLRYQKADGTTVTDTLNASLVVVLPPRLGIDLDTPLPTETNIGEPLMLSLKISNRGKKAVNFTTAVVTAENADVMDGAEQPLAPLRVDDNTTVAASVSPLAEGPVKITVTLNYIDDLNKPQTIVSTYEVNAITPPPMPTFEPPPDNGFPTQEEEQPVNSDERLGRLLLGLLGLGS